MRHLAIFLLALLIAGSAAAQTTAFPPDLPDVQPAPQRKLVVKAEPMPAGKGAVKPAKAAPGVTLRLVDADTGEVLATAPARSESAVLELPIPALPVNARQIEGRVADVRPDGGAVLAVGAADGVRRGDRFEILKITGEIKDPVTKTVLELDMVKIGEFVADTVHDTAAYGRYGGEPMGSDYATVGKGYAARLVTK